MKCKTTFVKIFAAFLFAVAAVGIGGSNIDSAVIHRETEINSLSCFPPQSSAAPTEIFLQTAFNRPPVPIMVRLFQLMFILFIISPPIIAVMLFLIWKELKKRNELK